MSRNAPDTSPGTSSNSNARKRAWLVVGILLTGAIGVGGALYYWQRPAKPNVLVITLDTTRADRLGPYGYKKSQTAAQELLAKEGVLFERAYATAPLTLVSHCSMFSGLYPAEHGVRTNGRGKIDPSIPTLATVLADNGYDCGAFIGAFVLDSKFGLDRGFSVYDDNLESSSNVEDIQHRERRGESVVEAALNWLTKPRKKPFYCWIHLYDPHVPYKTHSELFGGRFNDDPYDAEIAYDDVQIARLLEYLRFSNLEKDTLVVVIGDHGEGLGEHVEQQHGYTLYNATQHVPFVFRWPGRIAAGHRHPVPVSLVDFFPTMCELLGLGVPQEVSGRSLVPALEGQPMPPGVCYSATDDPLLQEGWSPLRSLTEERWKFIRTAKPELFDLQADPGERQNLVETHPEIHAEMEDRLLKMEQAMKIRKSIDVQLSDSERKALESLGYLVGAGGEATHDPALEAVDVKDMLAADVEARAALDLLHHGKVEEAAVRLQAVTVEAPLHTGAKVFLGQALEAKRDLPGAIAAYEAALQIKPDHLDALVKVGCVYGTLGRPEEAVKYLDDALRIDPNSIGAHSGLGLALQELGKTEEAVEHMMEALRLDNEAANLRLTLAEALHELGRDEEALKYVNQELQRYPRSVRGMLTLATITAKDQPEKAIKLLNDAIDLQPENPHARFQMGELLLSRGRAAEAVMFFTQAKGIMPELPGIDEALETARQRAAKSSPSKD